MTTTSFWRLFLSAHSFKVLADTQAPDYSMFGKDTTTQSSNIAFVKCQRSNSVLQKNEKNEV